MRTLYLVKIIFISSALSSCAMNDYSDTTQRCKYIITPIRSTAFHAKKNPLKISFYTKDKPTQPYTIIGQESISKYNMGGNRRQEASIRDGMRELAASMGGDAVINIKHDATTITGTVVAYQKDEKERG